MRELIIRAERLQREISIEEAKKADLKQKGYKETITIPDAEPASPEESASLPQADTILPHAVIAEEDENAPPYNSWDAPVFSDGTPIML